MKDNDSRKPMKHLKSFNESFAMSKELYQFIGKNQIDWSEFTDSLYDLINIKNVEINKFVLIYDQNGHSINVELEEDKVYRMRYNIVVTYYTEMRGELKNFIKTEDTLSAISISLQEMIDRASEKVKLLESTYKTEQITHRVGYGEIQYKFNIVFESGPLDMSELKKYYQSYKGSPISTPEFNKGMKELLDYYKKRNIDPSSYLDYTDGDDYILVGFIADDLYGIADYNIKSKQFMIDWDEVESSVDYMNETE